MSKYDLILHPETHHVPGYGVMHIGAAFKDALTKRWSCRVWNITSTGYPTMKAAKAAGLAMWGREFSGNSLRKRFTAKTRGGYTVRMHHQCHNDIVAAVYVEGGWRCTSFALSGKCKLSDSSSWDLVPQ